MKRLLLGLTLFAAVSTTVAQEAADKKYQAGLVAGFGLNFQQMGTKNIESLGAGTDFTIGANVNIGLTSTIAFNTGIEFDFERLRFKSGDSPVYYFYSDTDILQENEVSSNASANLFQMQERRQSATLLTIPTMMMFRTNYIGYFRYFGKFGLRNSFVLSSNSDDIGVNFDPENEFGTQSSGENENMSSSGEMFFFKSAVGAAGGAEWNFIGSTCLVAELGFYYGFTPLFFDRNEGKTFMYTNEVVNGNIVRNHFSNQARQTQLMLKISILF